MNHNKINVLVLSDTLDIFLRDSIFINSIHIRPHHLADQTITIKGDKITMNGFKLDGFIYLTSPNESLAESFVAVDQEFCNLEMKAVLLDFMNCKSLRMLNRFSAAALFRGDSWSYWRNVLLENGYSLSNLNFGLVYADTGKHNYYNFSTTKTNTLTDKSLIRYLGLGYEKFRVCYKTFFIKNKVIAGPENKDILSVIEFLNGININYGCVETTENNEIFTFNPFPDIRDSAMQSKVIFEIENEVKNYWINW